MSKLSVTSDFTGNLIKEYN